MPLLKDILNQMNQWADLAWAEEWDNPGIQVGEEKKEVKRILLALTPSIQAVEYACENQYDLLLTHHPLIFGKIKNITDRDSLGRMLLCLIKNDVAVASYHTNLDIAPMGVNDTLANALGLKNITGFAETGEDAHYKFVVYVPVGYEEKVREAICTAGGGFVGAYSDCTFRSRGTGTYKAQEGTQPFIGEIGVLEETEEYRLETIVPKSVLENVIKQMKQAHPYEEVAYDIFPLEEMGKKRYIGRVGELEEEISLAEFMQLVAKVSGQKSFSYSGDLKQKVRRVALCGGSAASYMVQAKKAGADVYLTADIKFHDYQKAEEIGIAIVDGGHFHTEKLILEKIQEYLTETLGLKADIFAEEDFVKHYNS